jgi:hypothetical protein
MIQIIYIIDTFRKYQWYPLPYCKLVLLVTPTIGLFSPPLQHEILMSVDESIKAKVLQSQGLKTVAVFLL